MTCTTSALANVKNRLIYGHIAIPTNHLVVHATPDTSSFTIKRSKRLKIPSNRVTSRQMFTRSTDNNLGLIVRDRTLVM